MAVPAYISTRRSELESISRQHAQAVPMHGNAILCRVLAKYLMLVDGEDFSVSPHLALNGYWESWTTIAIARAVADGAYAVDIGANSGYFTVLLGDAVGEGGRVLALEPNPRLTRLLERTLEVNGFGDRCQVVAAAAAAARSSTRLSVPPNRWADASIRRPPCASDLVLDVPATTVDAATAGWSRVDFIKIDAEGSEEAIWEGMRCTVRRNPWITVVMEFKPSLYADAEGFLGRIAADGFILRGIDDEGGVRHIDPADALQPRRGGDSMLFLSRT